MKIINIFILFFILFLNVQDAISAGVEKNDILNILNSEIGDIKTFEKEKSFYLEYWPDNTGTSIHAPEQVNRQEFWDFSYLYFKFIDSYTYNQKFHEKKSEESNIIISRYKNKCSETAELPQAKCVLRYLKNKNDIVIMYLRVDEGYICESIDTVLNDNPDLIEDKGTCREYQ